MAESLDVMHFQNCVDDVSFHNVSLGDLNEGLHLMLEITDNYK